MHFSCYFYYFVFAIFKGMNTDKTTPRNKNIHARVEHLLRYIDFVSRRDFSSTSGDDNCVAVFEAAMSLSAADYTMQQLHVLLDDVGNETPQALFVRQYYKLMCSVLRDDVNVSVDESLVMNFYHLLYQSASNAQSLHFQKDTLNIGVGAYSSLVPLNDNLNELIEWLIVRSGQSAHLSIEDIAIFLYRFVNNHLLPQGSEPIMLLLMHLLLRKAGCAWIIHCSPATVMAQGRVEYHRALHVGDESQWILYFVQSLHEAARRASAVFAPALPPQTASHKAVLNMRQRNILDFIGCNQPVGLSAIVEYMHKESVNTIKKDLQRLRTLGFIISDGVLKGTVYYKI